MVEVVQYVMETIFKNILYELSNFPGKDEAAHRNMLNVRIN